jgi:hypothetical protein
MTKGKKRKRRQKKKIFMDQTKFKAKTNSRMGQIVNSGNYCTAYALELGGGLPYGFLTKIGIPLKEKRKGKYFFFPVYLECLGTAVMSLEPRSTLLVPASSQCTGPPCPSWLRASATSLHADMIRSVTPLQG